MRNFDFGCHAHACRGHVLPGTHMPTTSVGMAPAPGYSVDSLKGLLAMNFGRVVRMAIRYKFTFAATIFSALIVAVLWGGIIGAVYPVVEVVFKNKSMQQWIDEQIAENQKTAAAKSSELEKLQKELAASEQSGDQK